MYRCIDVYTVRGTTDFPGVYVSLFLLSLSLPTFLDKKKKKKLSCCCPTYITTQFTRLSLYMCAFLSLHFSIVLRAYCVGTWDLTVYCRVRSSCYKATYIIHTYIHITTTTHTRTYLTHTSNDLNIPNHPHF